MIQINVVVGGETPRNFAVRTAEQNDPTHNSEPARHLKQRASPRNSVGESLHMQHKCEILEGLFLQQKNASLLKQTTMKQVISYIANIFQAGIT